MCVCVMFLPGVDCNVRPEIVNDPPLSAPGNVSVVKRGPRILSRGRPQKRKKNVPKKVGDSEGELSVCC